MRKIIGSILDIAYYLLGASAVVVLYAIFKSSVPSGLRWLFWVVFIGGLWLVAWIVARKQGKSFWDIWSENKESGSDQDKSAK
ncbi:MAG: hypothetical protein V1696_04005 [Candidatus Jorgensenbacteria bacterium]